MMLLKRIKTFLAESPEKTCVFAFGRFNPITAGHELLFNKVRETASHLGGTGRVYMSHSQDKKKNPIPYNDKIRFAKQLFPGNTVISTDATTVFELLHQMYEEGFTHVVMVTGSDREEDFQSAIKKYNHPVNPKSPNYNDETAFYFPKIDFVVAGSQRNNSSSVSGISASKMRGFAKDGDFASFKKFLPSRATPALSKEIYKSVRRGMGLSEGTAILTHGLVTIASSPDALIVDAPPPAEQNTSNNETRDGASPFIDMRMVTNEAFNTPYNWRWSYKGAEYMSATFRTQDGVEYGIRFVFEEGKPKFWTLAFNNMSAKDEFGITGTGNAMQVFATVIDITKAFLDLKKPKTVIWSGKKSDGHFELYKRMLTLFNRDLTALGYKGVAGAGERFMLTKLRQ